MPRIPVYLWGVPALGRVQAAHPPRPLWMWEETEQPALTQTCGGPIDYKTWKLWANVKQENGM